MNQSINQSISQSVNQSISQSINQSIADMSEVQAGGRWCCGCQRMHSPTRFVWAPPRQAHHSVAPQRPATSHSPTFHRTSCLCFSVHRAGKYTIFGQVIDGMEVLDRMEKTPNGPGDRPLQVRGSRSCLPSFLSLLHSFVGSFNIPSRTR